MSYMRLLRSKRSSAACVAVVNVFPWTTYKPTRTDCIGPKLLNSRPYAAPETVTPSKPEALSSLPGLRGHAQEGTQTSGFSGDPGWRCRARRGGLMIQHRA